MSFEIKNDVKNELLDRREITCTINNATGINRKYIRESVASQISANLSDVYIISINQSSGLTQISVLLYVYSDSNIAKAHLPDYLFKRFENDQKSGDESDKKENVTAAKSDAAIIESSESPSEEKPSASSDSNTTKEDNNAVNT